MQCTSFTPVYYHARDRNVGANGYSWHLYDSNASYGEERGFDISMPPCDQQSGYHKEAMRRIIQNHEATFRYQVRELHRLYRRQRDLMDETRMREIFGHHVRTSEMIHSLSHARADFPQNRSPSTNWLFDNLASSKLSELTSRDVQGHENLVAENLEETTKLGNDSFVRKSSIDNVHFLSHDCKEKRSEIVHEEKQFKVGNLSEAHGLKRGTPEEISNFQPPYSDFASNKTWDFSSSSSNIRKTNCFIDLNEPIQLESSPPSSSGPLEAFTCHSKTVCGDEHVPVKATPESIVLTRSQLLKSDDGSSDGINSSMAIDLNSIPVNYFSESEITVESPRNMNREAVHKKISDSYLKTKTQIDLNTGAVDEHSPPLWSSILEIKSAEETELKGPVSPENEESSPPRGKSEDIQTETPLSSEGEGESFTTIAAETLANIRASKNLRWFADIVSSVGDDLENEVMKLENDRGKAKALNSSCFNKAKGTGQKRRKKQREDFQTEEVECRKTGQLKRKAGKNGCAKPRKYSKSSLSDVTKKSMSWILKQSALRMDHGVVQSWGKMSKRRGGRKRRVSNYFLLGEMASL